MSELEFVVCVFCVFFFRGENGRILSLPIFYVFFKGVETTNQIMKKVIHLFSNFNHDLFRRV